MIDDIFIFDNVIHVYDMSDENLRTESRTAEHGRQQMAELGVATAWSGYAGIERSRRWTPEDLYQMVFEQAPTDMAMAQTVPIYEWFKDFFSPVKAQHKMAEMYPDRVLFCGGVDPLYEGVEKALDQIDYQVQELGARSMKFYNGHIDEAWRCDDEELAYPLYQRCQDRGIRVIQFHKGIPFGMQNVEALNPCDLQKAARDFPDLNFIIHHLALPYFEESVSIASRFPNVYLALSGQIDYFVIAPRRVQDWLGRLLMDVGVHKLLWGSEAALAGGPAPYLRAFMDLEIPEDMRAGYGYPQITLDDKRKILGENFAKLMGIDLAAKAQELTPITKWELAA